MRRSRGRLVGLGLALNGWLSADGRSWARIEHGLRRASSDHSIGDRVGMTLVAVTGLIDTPKELNTPTLLDNMRGLVRGGVEVWRAVERDRVAHREGSRTERMGGFAGGCALVSCDTRNVVATEAALDLVEVRELAATACHPMAG